MLKSSNNISNSSWNLANILLYPAAFLALTPFFINKLGETDFGIWMLINSYVYIAVHIVSFGMGNSIITHVAESLGKGNFKLLLNYINISTKTIAFITVATLGAAIIWSVAIILGMDVFGSSIDDILTIATILIGVKFWELLYQSILKGYERYDLASVYNIASKLLVLGAQIALVIKGLGLLEIFVSNVIINLIMVLIQAMVSYRLIPRYRFKWIRSKKEEYDLFHFGMWTWLQTIISVLAYQIDRFIVAIFLGPAVAGYYILASTIVNHMHMAFGAIVGWLLPKVSRTKEMGADIKLYFSTLRSFLLGFGLLSIFITFLFYQPLFKLWLGMDKFEKMAGFFKLFLFFEAYLLMTIVPLFYFNAVKMLKFITSMELMYKSGVIIGLFIAFAIVPTGDSIIIGQVIALILLVPVEYYLINKKLLKDKFFNETIVAFVPTIMLCMLMMFSDWYLLSVFLLIAFIFYRIYYLSPRRFKMKLLLE